ncbi:hypothetical protein LBBP_00647 [Leptospira borgpetersenii serovar Ballum]|uniref:Uncharacterized protein n=1 Tax=Leptospira borgpetersenii serovar Ballum TaxID=280505 RepID=A0A0S2IMT4_LEPBO|nr:hypothetical protein LBBP_00647 [Leptospira borgpetersenii serovar Ballum]
MPGCSGFAVGYSKRSSGNFYIPELVGFIVFVGEVVFHDFSQKLNFSVDTHFDFDFFSRLRSRRIRRIGKILESVLLFSLYILGYFFFNFLDFYPF